MGLWGRGGRLGVLMHYHDSWSHGRGFAISPRGALRHSKSLVKEGWAVLIRTAV